MNVICPSWLSLIGLSLVISIYVTTSFDAFDRNQPEFCSASCYALACEEDMAAAFRGFRADYKPYKPCCSDWQTCSGDWHPGTLHRTRIHIKTWRMSCGMSCEGLKTFVLEKQRARRDCCFSTTPSTVTEWNPQRDNQAKSIFFIMHQGRFVFANHKDTQFFPQVTFPARDKCRWCIYHLFPNVSKNHRCRISQSRHSRNLYFLALSFMYRLWAYVV